MTKTLSKRQREAIRLIQTSYIEMSKETVPRKECVIVLDKGVYTAGYFDITESIKLIIKQENKALKHLLSLLADDLKKWSESYFGKEGVGEHNDIIEKLRRLSK